MNQWLWKALEMNVNYCWPIRNTWYITNCIGNAVSWKTDILFSFSCLFFFCEFAWSVYFDCKPMPAPALTLILDIRFEQEHIGNGQLNRAFMQLYIQHYSYVFERNDDKIINRLAQIHATWKLFNWKIASFRPFTSEFKIWILERWWNARKVCRLKMFTKRL